MVKHRVKVAPSGGLAEHRGEMERVRYPYDEVEN
jgi:hypothetical protein